MFLRRSICQAPVCFALAAGSLLAQQPPPSPAFAFQAVHLLWVDTQQPHAEERVRSAVAALNAAIAQAGCAACRYHLWRVAEAAQGSYNYVQVSRWPSSAVYAQIHGSPEYLATQKVWEQLRSVVIREAYDREVEVPVEDGARALPAAAISGRGEVSVTGRGMPLP